MDTSVREQLQTDLWNFAKEIRKQYSNVDESETETVKKLFAYLVLLYACLVNDEVAREFDAVAAPMVRGIAQCLLDLYEEEEKTNIH